LAGVDLKTEWRQAAEEALRLSKLPYKAAEVGRYDVVCGASAVCGMLLPTGRALELDRALGKKANEDGTTFAMPPADTLGRYKLGNEHVTIHADRSRPRAFGTAGWDEEGVKPDDFTLVRDGVVVDYVTTRAAAPKLAAWYASRKQPMRSHGCAFRTGRFQPKLNLPNLALQPGAGSTTLEDLIADVKRGYYIESFAPYTDQQQLNILAMGGPVYEIINGRLGTRVTDFGVQFTVPRFWRSVAALGGAASGELGGISTDSSDLDAPSSVSAWTVPALVTQLDVVNTDRQA
jgi:TldD protein